MDECLSELGILKGLKAPIPSPVVGVTDTPANSSMKRVTTPSTPVLMSGSALASGHASQFVGTSPPVQRVQYPQQVKPQSLPRPRSQLRTSTSPHSPASRENYTGRSSSDAENPDFILEVVVLDEDSWGAGEKGKVRKGSPKSQRRGSVEKFTDTLKNVAREAPSLPSLKRFSEPPRLGPPSPSPVLPQSFSQQQQRGHGRSRSRSRSRPATPRTPPYPTCPTSPPSTTTKSSNSPVPRGVNSTQVLYTCETVCRFHPDQDVLYGGIGFHMLEVGTRLGVIQELGPPCMHPELPAYLDDGEDCLLLAVDVNENIGWAFASFLVPVD